MEPPLLHVTFTKVSCPGSIAFRSAILTKSVGALAAPTRIPLSVIDLVDNQQALGPHWQGCRFDVECQCARPAGRCTGSRGWRQRLVILQPRMACVSYALRRLPLRPKFWSRWFEALDRFSNSFVLSISAIAASLSMFSRIKFGPVPVSKTVSMVFWSVLVRPIFASS